MLLSKFWPATKLRHVVVTTFHEKGYNEYGKRCIETFLEYWPSDVALWVYAEDVRVEISDPRVTVFDHNATLPKLQVFRRLYKDNPSANGQNPKKKKAEYNFRWDAIRFSNKVFAVTDAIRRAHGIADQLIWLDADTVTHRELPHSLIDKLAPRGRQLSAYLNRMSYPECGWVGYNLNHMKIMDFAERFEQSYLSGDFLKLKENHDSYVFWKIVSAMEQDREAKFKFLGSRFARGHIFINSVLGGYMDHLKGDRKAEGKSRASDLSKKRSELWWS
ncbi:hypothetical protein QA644_14405 [Rhizobium sp. CC1099]|uniref:hypothetical protein n=1 Tax=Rhizobium sp. CC1099 TaxID=3039160 RepID=UPI0024B178E6|nr:hypothetical protein [Rhizobium sp. CC1099]WFU86321.1 hypothetical protein QA644_14405 [Rhizobium sp. CC1099]